MPRLHNVLKTGDGVMTLKLPVHMKLETITSPEISISDETGIKLH